MSALPRPEARARLDAILAGWRGDDLAGLIAALYRAGATVGAVGERAFWSALDSWRTGEAAATRRAAA